MFQCIRRHLFQAHYPAVHARRLGLTFIASAAGDTRNEHSTHSRLPCAFTRRLGAAPAPPQEQLCTSRQSSLVSARGVGEWGGQGERLERGREARERWEPRLGEKGVLSREGSPRSATRCENHSRLHSTRLPASGCSRSTAFVYMRITSSMVEGTQI